ncbi:GIY-YIG nuclease family protein [Streptomyces sp. NPDC047022]|uniref:GIY-YIG nuclease family protein n=1 Tax=Streptomyces sp. NPDC047022 TaxID=3155737 RepID=UPI0033C06AA0
MIQPPVRHRHLTKGGAVRYFDENDSCAVYRLFNNAGEIIYVGISQDPDKRIQTHARKTWGHEIARHEWKWYANVREAKEKEQRLIEKYEPQHNIVHTDRHQFISAARHGTEAAQRMRETLAKKRAAARLDAMEALGHRAVARMGPDMVQRIKAAVTSETETRIREGKNTTQKPCYLCRIFNAAGDVIYVAVSRDPAKLIELYRKEKPWGKEIARYQQDWEPDRDIADEHARWLISTTTPIGNVKYTNQQRLNITKNDLRMQERIAGENARGVKPPIFGFPPNSPQKRCTAI